ncbi:sugar porter family MFS transporter [Brevibacterium renqingii]|uniref:sugar porter family MFS transporter n=1 Tax=Brevibacterium renqingii TaxID=2776916 RepID=UPI001AE0DD5C|nr:sugar porter family MFS transporter [Brevibacterium renqingii]
MAFLTDLRRAPRLVTIVAVAAVALGITYGYDISNIAGALLFLETDLGLGNAELGGLATAVVIGQIAGALCGGPISNAIGRRRTMFVIAGGYIVFSVISGFAPGYVSLLVARLLLGVSIGIALAVVPVFIAESSPTNVRGGLLVAYQVTTVIGIVVGYLVCWALALIESWRLMLGIAALPAAVVFILLLRARETPHWLMLKGREAEAADALRALEPDRDIDHEVGLIRTELEAESGHLVDMFRGHLLKATMFVIGLGFFIQITGINATIYYAPSIFESMGFTGYGSLLGLPAVVQSFALIAVIVSMFIVDRLGRRPVLLTGIGIMIVSTLVLVLVFSFGGEAGSTSWGTVAGVIGIIAFTMGYTFGFGSLVWVYAGETFPAKYRALGASLMLTSDLVANAIVAQFFPGLLDLIGGAGVFIVFGVLSLLAFLFVFRFAPETKGRDLTEISAYWANGAKWSSPQR